MSDQTEEVREMLTNHQLRPAEFSNKDQKAIKGQIIKDNLISENRIVNQQMISEVVDENVSNEEQIKVLIKTLCVPINLSLGC